MKAISKLYRKVQEAKSPTESSFTGIRERLAACDGTPSHDSPSGATLMFHGIQSGDDTVMFMNPLMAAFMEYYPALWARREKRRQLRNTICKRRRM